MRYLFDPQWFNKHQKLLLKFANNPVGRYFFRVNGDRSSLSNRKIVKIAPNYIEWEDNGLFSREFRTHNKYSKRLFHGLYPLWYLMHTWDMLFANRFAPNLNLGFDTLTVYPDASAESTSVDGWVGRTGVNESFGTIRGGAGTTSNDSSSDGNIYIEATATTDQYAQLFRTITLFDTSSLNDGAVIVSAVYSLYGRSKSNGLGSLNLSLVTSTPASNTAIVNADYSQVQFTKQANDVTYASWTVGAYADWTLNATGLSNISKTGISKFACIFANDADNSAPTWSSGAFTDMGCETADETGTTKDPRLVITYSGVSPSASQSPSSSVSASTSPSPSRSLSLSPSLSGSPSPSASVSLSPSVSESRSPSVSTSASPSTSISASQGVGSGLFSKEALSSMPVNKNNLAIAYGEDDDVNVSTLNQVRVHQIGTTGQYMAHQYKIRNTNSTDFIEVNVNCRTTLAPSTSTVYLQIWNVDTEVWETIDSESVEGANTDFYLTAEVQTNQEDYYDTNHEVTIRVYQLIS